MPPAVVKLPVPDQAAQDNAEKALREKYKDDYSHRKPEELLALCARFLQPGREDRKDPAGWFVLLREARDLAVQIARPRLAVEAINEIDRWFLIDAHAMKVQALTTIAQTGGPEAARLAGQVALGQVEAAVAQDNYDAALKLVAAAEAIAARAQVDEKAPDKVKADEKLLAQAKERKEEVEAWKKAYQPVAEAQKKLAAAPNDPDANLTLGRHLCYFQNEWNKGLPHLARGGNAELKALADKDLARPGDVKGQIAVGDGWWNLVKVQSGRTATNVRRRAAYWYESAEPGAAPEDRRTISVRINEVLGALSRPSRLPPGSFLGRGTEDRILLLREGGGSMRTEEAVERGLEWLAAHQSRDGSWSNDAFNLHAKCTCTECGKKHDIAGAAFGLLPFLGAGQTHKKGRYAKTVEHGLQFLLKKQSAQDGKFSDNMYEHALATIAVCEAYGMTKDQRLANNATAAALYIGFAQNERGGWGYSSRASPGDLSVTGWQFSALKTAYYAGVKFPDTFARVSSYLETMADPNGLGYGYNAPGAGKATTATGLLCREYLGWGPRQPNQAKGIDFLLRPDQFPNKESPSIYFLFYATQVMHHAGGKAWETWNPKARDLLLELQDEGKTPNLAHQKGSWSPRGSEFAEEGGRLMFTSLALITLEVYYYHVPLYGYGPAVAQE
jgi:hypothetical protein